MSDPFDIFQLEADGSVRWLRAEGTLESAKAFLQERAECLSCEYMILDQRTGSKFLIKLEELAGAAEMDRKGLKDAKAQRATQT